MKIYIGTSGWQHEEMEGIFYPKELPKKQWLPYYMEHFPTVEINTSFYHMKLASVYKKWRKEAPKDFIFAAKIFRYVTHIKRLIIDEESLPILRDDLKNLSALGDNLGPILIQLPPGAKYNHERLETFLDFLTSSALKIFKRQPMFAMEFRHPSWLNEDTYSLLRKYQVAFCISDSPDWPTAKVMTADWAYVRLHGRPRLFESLYGKNALERWAREISELGPKQIFVYFNNSSGQPTENARALIRIMNRGQETARPIVKDLI